jgi:hypothetical protein
MAKPPKRPAKRPAVAPPVLLYRLGDLPVVRHAVPLFELPASCHELAFYVLGKRDHEQSTLFDRLPEPRTPAALQKRVLALAEAIAELLTSGEGCPVDADDYGIGYHAGAAYPQVVQSFLDDGFNVVHAADLVRQACRPRDPAASEARLARAGRAMGKKVDRLALDVLVLDEAIETWSAVEDEAFQRLARQRALGGLRPTADEEPIGVDRWGLFAAQLARAGFAQEEIDAVWLDGLTGDRQWPSALWFAMALLPRLEEVTGRILARAADIDPARALTRLLVDPIEELPFALDAHYRAGVERVLGNGAVASTLSSSDRERLAAADKKRFGKLVAKAGAQRRSTALTASASAPAAARLAELTDLYGVTFPDDMLAIWDLACSLSPRNPRAAFADDDLLGISLVGPFDVLAGQARVRKGLDIRLHWRFRFDPPELFTVASGNEDGLHFGYWFDEPAAGAACVAAYYAHDAFEIEVPGRTLGEALRRWLERAHAGVLENLDYDPAHEAVYVKSLAGLARLRERLRTVCTRDRPEVGEAYLSRYHLGAMRGRAALLETPERMGVVAPAERHRPLSLAGPAMAAALAAPRRRQALVAEALELCRQGFPVAALALGRTCWARALDDEAYALLDAAYAGLDRAPLGEVLAVHRQHRDLPSVDVLAAR